MKFLNVQRVKGSNGNKLLINVISLIAAVMKIYFPLGFVPESLKDQENSQTMHSTVAGAERTQSPM